MRKIAFVTLLILSSYLNSLWSWDSTAAKYMPLRVGNVWVYYGTDFAPPYYTHHWYRRSVITGLTDTLGKRYYRFENTGINFNTGLPSISFTYLRIDSSSMNLFAPGTNTSCTHPEEQFVDSLPSRKSDTSWICKSYGQYIVCRDTAKNLIFGDSIKIKSFNNSGRGNLEIYAFGIGETFWGWAELQEQYSENLVGCIINGQLHGDTSMIVGIRPESSETPGSFSLYQNYPNPFNPSTKIKFDIPVGNDRDRSVMLNIYNSLGQEVAVLVNEQLRPGTYEAEWNAADYASGIYYYKLTAGEFSETKKMVLIK
jgi:hypothetical protein